MPAMGRADALNIGLSPSAAMGMTYLATADSLSLQMANAVANQQRGQVLAAAAVAQVLALVIAGGAAQETMPPTTSKRSSHDRG